MRSHSTRRALLAVLVGLGLLLGVTACGSDSSSSGSTATTAAEAGPKVVASTSWVGAVAKMAGATDITVIAPSNIQHPPDYDPKASDLAALADADYVLLAGFEGFATKMKEASGSGAEVVTVAPDYDPAKLTVEVEKLAAMWGTESVATANLADYTKGYEASSAEVKKTTASKPETIVAQAFVAGWVVFAGYEPVGTYGPEPTSAGKVSELSALKPTMIWENVHMGGGAEIATATGAELVNLVNFPGDDLELMPVVEENAKTITAAVG